MKVLLAASEVAPIIKIGGLGDVVGSLPKSLEKLGVDVDVIVPFYPVAKTEGLKVYQGIILEVPFGNATHEVTVHKTKLPGSNVDVILLKNHEYFAGGGANAFLNDKSETEMFAFFNRAVVEYIKSKFNTYDLVHCNDWHTGLITHLLEDELGPTRPATLLTIHNLGYQGVGDEELVQEVGFVPGDHKLIDWDIEDGDLNLLQQGISSADFINTVSETYASEIMYKDIGGPLSEILQDRQARVVGILNGIDYSQFERDYNKDNWKEHKKKAKSIILNELGLEDDGKPLFSYIGRLDPGQKGLEVLFDSIPEIVKKSGQFVLLGTGDKLWEGKLKDYYEKEADKKNISINIVFDVDLAKKIYSGSDCLLVPSKYEPCGLIQMIAMHYGTLPIVHATGGLKDTVKEGENGYVFNIYSTKELNKALHRAFEDYGTEKFDEYVVNALTQDFSWDKSASKYKRLYQKAIDLRHQAVELAQSE